MPIIILIQSLQVGKSTFIYTTPTRSYTNKVKIGKKGRGNVNVCVSSDEILNFFFINEILGKPFHENIVKITYYPYTPVLEKITVALAT